MKNSTYKSNPYVTISSPNTVKKGGKSHLLTTILNKKRLKNKSPTAYIQWGFYKRTIKLIIVDYSVRYLD